MHVEHLDTFVLLLSFHDQEQIFLIVIEGHTDDENFLKFNNYYINNISK